MASGFDSATLPSPGGCVLSHNRLVAKCEWHSSCCHPAHIAELTGTTRLSTDGQDIRASPNEVLLGASDATNLSSKIWDLIANVLISLDWANMPFLKCPSVVLDTIALRLSMHCNDTCLSVSRLNYTHHRLTSITACCLIDVDAKTVCTCMAWKLGFSTSYQRQAAMR
jgi:hypothetical protein